jgi:hypothetical protein
MPAPTGSQSMSQAARRFHTASAPEADAMTDLWTDHALAVVVPMTAVEHMWATGRGRGGVVATFASRQRLEARLVVWAPSADGSVQPIGILRIQWRAVGAAHATLTDLSWPPTVSGPQLWRAIEELAGQPIPRWSAPELPQRRPQPREHDRDDDRDEDREVDRARHSSQVGARAALAAREIAATMLSRSRPTPASSRSSSTGGGTTGPDAPELPTRVTAGSDRRGWRAT